MRWTDLTAEPLAAHSGGAPSREARARVSRVKFRLEPIEPRILLSSDSIATELLRPLDHKTVETTLEIAPIIQVIAPALRSETGTVDGDANDGAALGADLGVALAEWTVDIGDESAPNSEEVAIVAASAVDPEGSNSSDETAVKDPGFSRVVELLLSDSFDDASSRGPPEADYLLSTGANATPSATPLTSLLLDPIVAAAISRWSASGLQPFVSPLLTSITFTISNLAAGILAQIAGTAVTIDETADGHGWYIDPSPNDDAEFSPVSTDAGQGMDLLTVVLHELGHAMGFAHAGQLGLQGVEVMEGVLGEGVRRLPQLSEGMNLNDVFDVILATFDPLSPPTGQVVFSGVTTLRLPSAVTIGETPVGGADLKLKGLQLTFSELAHATSWEGEVLVESDLGILMPENLDIVIVDDAFGVPMAVVSASAPTPVTDGWSVMFTVNGDHSDLESGKELGVLNSNEAGFDDTDPNDSRTVKVSSALYSEALDQTIITVIYNFDPGAAAWTGGSVLAAETPDPTDDVDLVAVSGTIQLALGDDTSLLKFESLKAADLGWPSWLVIQITDLKLEFNDFRADDGDSHLKLDAAFLGFDTGIALLNVAIGAALKVEGAADGIILDMDLLAGGSRLPDGPVIFGQLPIVGLSGISGFITSSIPKLDISGGFILKSVGIDAAGSLTTNTNETERTIIYAAVRAVFKVGGVTPAGPVNKDGKPPAKVGEYEFGLNFAISGQGPLQLFVYLSAPILLEPASGLTITELRGGVRFDSTIEDLQVRPPFTATGGSAVASGDLTMPVAITLTVPGHNLKVGDEFRITAAADPDLESSGPDHFVVTEVNGNAFTYKTGGSGYESNPNNYSFGGTIEVKKISISDPFDLRDPGFASSKDLTLDEWEAQLDQQVVNQANEGLNVWDVLFDDIVIEAGATLSLKPRVPEWLVRFEVDLLIDTNLQVLLNGTMVVAKALKIPVKIFGDFSDVGNGAIRLLALMDIPASIGGIQPLLVVHATITLETLVNGVPATLDALTGFPAGIGSDVTAATIADLSPTGGGPWKVTFTLAGGTDATTLFEVGDSIAIVGSRPDVFNGTFVVTDVTTTTVSFVIGSVLLDGLVDVDRSGTVDTSDNDPLAAIPIIGGRLDMNKDEEITAEDDGEIFNVVRDAAGNRVVVAYVVIDGEVDVEGDGVSNGNDDAVIGEDPRIWDAGFDLTRNVKDGLVDVDQNGIVDTDDIGSLGDLRVLEGRLDMNRDGVADANDDGTLLNVVIGSTGNRIVTSYDVIDGFLDINGDDAITATDDLALAMGTDLGGYWIAPAFKVANQDDLGDGIRISVEGGIDLNIPTVTTLSLNGFASLDLTFGGASDARLDLTVDVALSETNVGDIGHANGKYTITLDVLGGPVVAGIPTPKVEIWGAVVLTTNFGFLENVGLFADASAVLILNTTSMDKPAVLLNTATGVISVVPTAQTFAVRLDGSIDFRIDFTGNDTYETFEQVFLLEGTFVLSFTGAQGFNVALFSEPSPGVVGPAILKIGPGSSPLLQFTAFGFLAIRANGIAANIVIGLSAGGPFSDFASVSGQFVFMLNTTGTDITFVIPAGTDARTSSTDLTVSIPRAPPGSIAEASLDVFSLIAGTAWSVPAGTLGAPYLLILLGGTNAVTDPDAHLTIGGFDLRGKFGFLASFDLITSQLYIELQVNASLELQPLDGLLLASGSLKINDDGVVGSLAIGGQLLLAPLTIVGAFTLEVNTTDFSQVVQRYEFDFVNEVFQTSGGEPVVQNVTVDPHTISLFAFAKFKLTGSFLLQGSVFFTNSPTLLSLDVDMTMDFFGAQLSVEGGARIVKAAGSAGLVLKLSASLDASAFGSSGIFSITGNLEVRINTRPLGLLDENDLGVARQTFRVQVSNASLSLLSVITLRGSGFVEMTQGVFRMEAELSGNFLSVASVSASVFLSSEGEFRVTLDGSVFLGTTGFNISGSAHLVASLLDSNGISPLGSGAKVLSVAGSLTVTGTLFFIPLPQVTIGVAYNSGTGAITVLAGPVPVPGIAYQTVHIPLVGTIRVPYPIVTLKYFSFTIGTLKLGPPPPPALLGQVDGSGLLTLNVGASASARNLQEDEIDESVLIDGLGDGSTRGQKIQITMFGVSMEFDNVLDILIADMGDGADFVQIADTVHIPIEVHFGDGVDTLSNAGPGVVVAHGDAGDDFLTGGTSADHLFGDLGDDVIQAGPGADHVDGGGDSDLLIWDAGDGSDTLIDGKGGTDTLNIRGTDSPDDITVQADGTGFVVSVGGETLTVDGVEGANIEGHGGNDTFTIDDLTASLLSLVTLLLGADSDPDSVGVHGSDSAETFDVSAEVVSLTTVDENGTPVVTEAHVLQLSKTSGVTVNVFDATTLGGDTITLDTQGGDDTINILSILAGASTTVNGGVDSDEIHVGNLSGIAAPLTINGNAPSSGSDVLNIDDSGDTLGNTGTLTSTTITGLGLGPAGIVYGGIEHLNISMGSGPDTFTVASTAIGTETTLNANEGNDIVNIRAIAGTTTIDGGNDSDTFNVGSMAPAAGGTVNGIAGLLTLNGNGSSDVLNVDETGDPGSNTGTLTSSAITGLGMTGSIGYGTIETVNVNLGSGDDTLNVQSTSVLTTVNTGSGAAANTVHAGSGNLSSIVGKLLVNGQSTGNDTLNVDDTGDATANTGLLTSTTLTGLGIADSIAYTSIDTLNISLGSGGNTFNVRSTSALTTVNTGTGANTVNVGSAAPATGGNVNGIAGKLVVNGQGSDTVNVDETGDSAINTGTLTNTRLTGLGMAGGDATKGIQYAGVDALNINLGTGADTLTIESTSPGTATTINANNGADTLNVRAISGTTTIDGGNDSDTFNVGSMAPAAGGTVNGIAALLTLNGNQPSSGSDILNVDDSGDSSPNVGTLTSSTITGLGISPAGIVYAGMEHLTISLGSGGDSFTINSTHRSATAVFDEETTVNMGSGNDTVHIHNVTDLLVVNGDGDEDTVNVNGTGAESTSTLHGNSGNDIFNVRAMNGDVNIRGDGGDDTVNVGSDAPALPLAPTTEAGTLDAINGLLTVDGGAGTNDVLNVDDSDPANDAKTGTLTASTIRDLELERGVDYSNIDRLHIWLAFGNNTFNINSTHTGETTVNTAHGEDTVNVNGTAAGSVTTLNGESGDDIFNIRGMNGRVHVWGGTGDDTVNVADTGQNLDQIQGPLILDDGNAPDADAELGTIDTLNVFHGNNNDADTGRLFYRTASAAIANPGLALTGFGMGGDSGGYGGGITYNGFEIVEVLLGMGNESLNIDDTGDRDEKAAIANDPAAITAIHGGGGNDTITITNRGNGPLVVYGDMGADTVNAAAMAAKTDPFVGIVIYGGPDNDIITGTQDDDQLAGGSGDDTINGEAGADHIYGDSHIAVDLQLFAQDQIERFDTDTDLSLINAMLTVTTSGAGDADSINGGNDSDVIFGDQGVIGQIDGVRRIESTGSMVLLQTDNVANGAGDNIHGGAGNDFVFGGAGNDTLYGDSGSDLMLGDHGIVAGDVDASAIGQVDGAGVVSPSAVFLYTSDSSPAADATAGNDTIYGGSLSVLDTDSGKNILLGQQGSDTIYGGASDDDIYGGHNIANGADAGDFIDGAAGNDVILGDNGLIERTAAATDPRFTVLTGTQIYDPFGNALVADGVSIGANPASVEPRRIQLFDHDDSPAANAGNFGDDTLAGGADDDVIFGQLGDDAIHGGAGDDYIEGNGGDDTIYGGAGQDDIVGGSSDLYSLGDAAMRPDGADTIFGGNGDMASRNNGGDALHGSDSDTILGDNGNILRLVGINGSDGGSLLQFAYDNYAGRKIVVRAAQLLDYTPGGPDFSGDAASDIGDGDEIHGESGDDFIYGQKGDDVLFGDAQDDDLLGGYGNDWISGGTGDDGVIGDDGRIYTSRNGTAEPLNGVAATTEGSIGTPGNFQQAVTNPTGQLKKAVDLTPFSQDPGWGATDDEFSGGSTHTSDDVIYGGLGNDWLHGGSGDDAISGAEALPLVFAAPNNPGNVLGYSLATGTFAAYDEFAPMANIPGFLLNFVAGEGPATGTVFTDGDDKIFGDLGNDWLVGGTGRDDIYGGWGSDLMNADDDQTTNGGVNDQPDNQPSYEDRAFGGAGIDVLIGNTGGDRLIDWVGDFNSYIVPFTSNNMGTISRTHQAQLAEFLYALAKSDGADPTRAADTGSSPARNGEPFGELGVIVQHDFAWHDQTGATPEVQLGSIPAGPREVLKSANFNGPPTTTAGGFSTVSGFSPDSGTWAVVSGALQVSAESLGGDAVSVLEIGDALPGYFEIMASVLSIKPTGGWEANSFIVFDYQGKTDFKFAGIDVSTNKLVMGHRNASGWHVDQQAPVKGGLKADKYYNLLLSVNGLNATLVVDNELVFTHTYLPRVVEGYSYGLNWGIVGVGSNNARGAFDNIRIQILPPQVTFDQTEDFAGAPTLSFTGYTSGLWSVGSSVYTSNPDGVSGLSLLDLGPDNLAVSSYLELTAKVTTTAGLSGFVFDRYPDGSFKFAAIDAATDQVVIGHYTTKSGWVSDAVLSMAIHAGTSYTLGVALKGTTVSLTLDGQTLLGHTFNAATVDGSFGLLNTGFLASFDDVRVKTNDPGFTAAA